MTILRSVLILLTAGFLSSCASLQQNNPPPMLDRLKAEGISPATYAKIANKRVLTYDDIYGLVKKGVPGRVIQTYLQSTHAPYNFTSAQLEKLSDAGASPDLINYLGKSVGFFEATERSQTGGAGKWKNDPFFADPYYMGAAPFGYMWPGEWYDPAFGVW